MIKSRLNEKKEIELYIGFNEAISMNIILSDDKL